MAPNQTAAKELDSMEGGKNSLCQMILKKISVPVGIDGRMCWDSMLLSMTNGKFCSLRSNFKQEIFKKFQGET